jgi:hypothetical protein
MTMPSVLSTKAVLTEYLSYVVVKSFLIKIRVHYDVSSLFAIVVFFF